MKKTFSCKQTESRQKKKPQSSKASSKGRGMGVSICSCSLSCKKIIKKKQQIFAKTLKIRIFALRKVGNVR